MTTALNYHRNGLDDLVGEHEGPQTGYSHDGSKWHKVFWRMKTSFIGKRIPPKLMCIAACKMLTYEDEEGQIIFGSGRTIIGTPQIFEAPIDASPICEDCQDPSKCPPLCKVCSDPMCVTNHGIGV